MKPKLTRNLDPNEFLQYYYLSQELVDFCKENGIKPTGGKKNVTKKIEYFLRTGNILEDEKKEKVKHNKVNNLTLDSIIEENFVCTEIHRKFFKEIIGNKFTFNVMFQNYLKNNAGRTYQDAINEWYKIQEYKKQNKGNTIIDSQFEFNTYIRDFFKDNKNETKKTAIKCWNYKKSIKGINHKYEKTDLLHIKK